MAATKKLLTGKTHVLPLLPNPLSKGKYKSRKPIDVPEFEQVTAKWKSGTITAAEAIRTLHMTKTTFYRKVRQK